MSTIDKIDDSYFFIRKWLDLPEVFGCWCWHHHLMPTLHFHSLALCAEPSETLVVPGDRGAIACPHIIKLLFLSTPRIWKPNYGRRLWILDGIQAKTSPSKCLSKFSNLPTTLMLALCCGVCWGSFLLIFNPFSLILTPSYGITVSAEYQCWFELALQIRSLNPELIYLLKSANYQYLSAYINYPGFESSKIRS